MFLISEDFIGARVFLILARSEGFEPSTAWFVARYSIQLSYERAKNLYLLFNEHSWEEWRARDRKSTRLNSSHVRISYAVFCLKKKKKKKIQNSKHTKYNNI